MRKKPITNHWHLPKFRPLSNLRIPWSGWLRRPVARVVGLSVIASLAVLAVVILRNPFQQVEAGWWDGGWQYRQIITVTNNESSDLTDYPVSISLDTATLISAGKMQSDCRDMRFINQGGQELPFWIEENNPGCNNAATKIWVKIPNIPADNGTIAVYYGNPSVSQSTKQSGLAVFDFFDDFNSGSDFDATRWQACSATFSSAISGGELTVTKTGNSSATKLIATNAPTGSNFAMRTRAKATTFSTSDDRFGVSTKTNTSTCFGYNYVQHHGYTTHQFLNDGVAWDATVYNESVAAAAYRTTETYNNGTNLYGRVNDGTWRSVAWTGLTGSPALNLGIFSGTVTVWDWALVRKITANEPTTSFASEETTPDPVAEWKFDEGQGQTVHDSSKQSNNGTLGATSGSSTDDPTWVAEDQCVSGKCLKFDGSSDHVATSIQSTQYSSYTYTAWFNMTQVPTTENHVIFARKDGSAEQGNVAAFVRGTTGQLVCGHRLTSGWVESGVHFSAYNAWNQITCVWDGSTFYTYVNGKLIGSGAAASFDTPDNEMRIGGDFPFNDKYFPGFIDEVKIYPYARSAAQIKADYAAGAAVLGATDQSFLSDGLVGYWKMDEASWNGTSGEVKDASGANNNGTRVGNATTGVGKFGSGGAFDGTGDYITMVGNPVKISGDTSISYSLWIKPDSISSTRMPLGLLDNSEGTGTNAAIFLNTNGNGSIGLHFGFGGQNTASGALSTSEWKHVVLVKTPGAVSANTVKIYVNGNEQVTSNQYGTPNVNIQPDKLNFGAGWWSGDGLYPYDGSMDEVRIYNRALSADEVKALYNFAPGPVLHLKLDEGTDQLVSDISTYDNSGTLGVDSNESSDDPSWKNESDCVVGKCLYFGTDADHLKISDDSTLDIKNAVTVAAWVNPSQLDYDVNSRAYNHIISKWNAYALRVYDHPASSTYGFDFTIFDSSSGYQAVGGTSGEIPAMNRWYYVVGTYDGTTVKTYVDGVLKYSTAHTGDIDLSANNLFIGSYEGLSAGTRFNGFIDNIKIYNYARTEAQIQQDMMAVGDSIQASSVLPQPIAHWGFDEQASQTVVDRISSNNGTLGADSGASTDDPAWKTKKDCKINGCLSFDGSNDVVKIPQSPSLSLGSKSFTITTWVKPELLVSGNKGIVSTNAGTATNYVIAEYNNGNFRIFMDDNGTSGLTTTTKTYNPGSWYHVAYIRDNASSRFRIYVNGIEDTNASVALSTSYSVSNNYYLIGSGDGVTNRFINASIDEVKIYNTALTASQVAQDYAAGSSVVFGTTASSEAADLADGEGNPPVGYWNFNDSGTPTTIADVSSTNSSQMTLLNTENSDWTKGKIGSGLELDGTNEFAYLSNPVSALKPATTLTVEAWVKADSITHGSPSRPYLVALQPPGSWQDGRGYALQIDSNGKARFQLGNASGSWKVATGATTLTTGTWYHLVGTYDGSTIKVYVNGKLDGTTSQSMTISYSTSGCGTCRPNPTTLYFGAEHSNSGTGNTDTANMYFFDGVIDEVKIYDYARTPAQVAYDYNRGKPIAHWKLNECQGTTINDASGNGHTGTLTVTASGGNTNGVGTCNTATSAWGSGATGKYGASLNFDGSGDYATITDPNDILDFDSDFSISSWFKTNSSGEQTIINRGQNLDWQYAMFTSLSGTGTGTVTCKVYVQNGGGDYLQATSSQSYVNGSWHQATCTISGTNMYLYVDGKLVGSDTTPTGTRDTASAGEFYIGKFNWSGDYALFNGQIDDVQIFNYALSDNQVKKLYNESSALRFGE